MKSRLILNIVVCDGAAVLQLLAREDQALKVWRDALLVLDHRLHVLDRVRAIHLQGDDLARERLHEDLYAVTTPNPLTQCRRRVYTAWQPQHKMKCRLILNIVVCDGVAVLQ